LTNTETTR